MTRVRVMCTVPPSPVRKVVEQVLVPAGRSSKMLTWRLEWLDWNMSRGGF